jgi:uncharacterized protein (DUF427 family)
MSETFTIAPAEGTHVVRAGDAIIAETAQALILRERGHDPVIYFPRADVAMELLDPSDKRTSCPHRGRASHYHIAAMSGSIVDAAWSYEDPIAGAEPISGYLAFCAEKATVEELSRNGRAGEA